MSFRQEGEFAGAVTDAKIRLPKFPRKDGEHQGVNVEFDVCLQIETDDGQNDCWLGEISNRMGVGNFKEKSKEEQTLDTLRQIGLFVNSYDELLAQVVEVDSNGELIATLPNAVGLKVVAVIKGTPSSDGQKTWYNLKYIKGADSGKQPAMSLASIRQLRGGAPQQQQIQQQQQTQQQMQQQQIPQQQQQGFQQAPQQQQSMQQAPVQQQIPQQQQDFHQAAGIPQQNGMPPAPNKAGQVPNPYAPQG